MAINVTNSRDRDRLHQAIKTSRIAIEPYNRDRTEMLCDYCGPLYGLRGKNLRRYVNKLNTTAGIYQMTLCFNNPQCKITSFNQKFWPFCRKYEINVNRVSQNIDLKTTLQECVLDAFFLMGVAKVRIADAGFKEIEPNLWLDPGKPWVDRVSFADLILDMPGKSLRAMRFMGDRYRASWAGIQERDDFEAKVVRQMSPSSKQNDNVNSVRADSIAVGTQCDDDELEPMCWLEDVYIPQTQELVTFAADHESLAPLKVQKWEGHPQGPYKFLGLGYVSDNVLPLGPATNLVLLDRLMNRLYRKLSAQSDREKQVTAFEKGQEDDALNGKNAKDGEFIGMRNPKSLVPLSFPGVDGNTHAFFLAAAEVYNVQAGNERMIGGLGAESSTVGQEEIIQAHSGGRIAYMKGAVNQFASDILREIGGLMWDDEALEVESSMEAEHTGYHVDTSWNPGDREGLKDHYDFSVEPNSMAYQPPEAKIQKINNFIQQYMQIFQAVQAGLIDGPEYARIVAEYQNIPEIIRIVKSLNQSPGEGGGDSHAATKPANTTREVVRKSVNQGPQGQGMAAVLGQVMQGNQNRQPMMAGAR